MRVKQDKQRKMAKYAHLKPTHAFALVAIETSPWSLWATDHGIPEGVESAVGLSIWG